LFAQNYRVSQEWQGQKDTANFFVALWSDGLTCKLLGMELSSFFQLK